VEIRQRQHGAVTVLRPDGSLIGAEADEVKGRLMAVMKESHGRFVLDASAVAFIDSRGLEVLVEVNDQLAPAGQALKLCGENKTLRQVLELTELASLFEHFEDVNAAVRSFL